MKNSNQYQSKRPKNWRKPYSQKEMEFISANYMAMTDAEIGIEIERTAYSIKTQRHKMGLWMFHREDVDWTEEEIEIFKKYYPNTSNDDMLKLLPGRKLGALYKKTQELGVVKDADFLLAQNRRLGEKLGELGKGHRFKKGLVPHNIGMKQVEYMSPEAIEKTKVGHFKKGEKPHNALYNGAITIRKDSNGGQYVYIKIDESNWRLYHHVIWERHNDPIPEGYVIRFTDGNTLNVCIENLECITMAEHVLRNRASNPEAALEGLRKYQAKYGSPAKRLTDGMVAFWLSGNDNDLKEYILEHRPDLIKVARANYKLKREIKKWKQ